MDEWKIHAGEFDHSGVAQASLNPLSNVSTTVHATAQQRRHPSATTSGMQSMQGTCVE